VKAFKGHAIEEEKKGDTEEGKILNLQFLMTFV
jgi:hypothetical protein